MIVMRVVSDGLFVIVVASDNLKIALVLIVVKAVVLVTLIAVVIVDFEVVPGDEVIVVVAVVACGDVFPALGFVVPFHICKIVCDVLVVVLVTADFIIFIIGVSQEFKITIVVACNDEVVVPDTGKGVAAVAALGTSTVTSVLGFVDDNPGDVVPALEAVVSFVFSGNLEFDIVIDLVVPGDFEVTSDEEVVDFVVVPSVTVVVAFVVCSDGIVFDFVNTGDSLSSSVIVGVFVACGDT